jgi:hypothetical protein
MIVSAKISSSDVHKPDRAGESDAQQVCSSFTIIFRRCRFGLSFFTLSLSLRFRWISDPVSPTKSYVKTFFAFRTRLDLRVASEEEGDKEDGSAGVSSIFIVSTIFK